MLEAAIDGTSNSNIILFFWRRDDSDYASLQWIGVEEAALLLAGSRRNWLLPDVALIPFYVRGALRFCWRLVQLRQALKARLPWPIEPEVVRGDKTVDDMLSVALQCQ